MHVRPEDKRRTAVPDHDICDHPGAKVLGSNSPEHREVFRVVVVVLIVQVGKGLLPNVHAQEVYFAGHLQHILLRIVRVQLWWNNRLRHMLRLRGERSIRFPKAQRIEVPLIEPCPSRGGHQGTEREGNGNKGNPRELGCTPRLRTQAQGRWPPRT